MRFDNLDDIIVHLASPYNNRVFVAKEYSIQDLIDDLIAIGRANSIVSDSLLKAALEWEEYNHGKQ